MSDFVTQIHLFDTMYQTKLDSIDVNQQITVPQFLDDDRPHCQSIMTYELKSRTFSHNGRVEAQYALCIPKAGTLRTAFSYLLSLGSHLVYSGIAGIPSQAIVYSAPTPPVAQFPISVIPSGMWSFDLSGYGDTPSTKWKPSASEPDCHCDMRMLMSAEHPAGCPWMVWKRTQKKDPK